MNRATFALALVASQAIATSLQVQDHEEFINEVIQPHFFPTADVQTSSKLIGRVGWAGYFDFWVNMKYMNTNANDVNKNPCSFYFICGKPFSDNDRIALHLSHGCPKQLIDQMIFGITLPNVDLVLHSDNNMNCVEDENNSSKQTCTAVLTTPKTSMGSMTGNDAAVWFPSGVTEDNLEFGYSYNIAQADPSQYMVGNDESGSSNFNGGSDDSNGLPEYDDSLINDLIGQGGDDGLIGAGDNGLIGGGDSGFGGDDSGFGGDDSGFGGFGGDDPLFPGGESEEDIEAAEAAAAAAAEAERLRIEALMQEIQGALVTSNHVPTPNAEDYTWKKVVFAEAFEHGGSVPPHIIRFDIVMDSRSTYLGLQATVSNGVHNQFIQMQAYDVWGQLETGTRRITKDWAPNVDDLGVHYMSSFAIVGMSSFYQGFPAAFVGNYFETTALQEDFDLDHGVCGFYYAYSNETGYLGGFRPIVCDDDHL